MKIRTAILLFVLTLAVVVVVGGAAGSGLAHGQDAPSATSTPFGVYLPLAATGARGSQFVELGSPADLAVVGEPYTSTAPVLVYHVAYSITGFALVEQAAFGATAPQITPGGLVTWLPTAADVGVHRYGLAATVSDGSQVQESVTIEVAPRTWIISGTVGSEGGAFGMPGDDYYVEIPPNAVAVDADNVHVGVSVVKRAAGNVQMNQEFVGLRPNTAPTLTLPLYAVAAPAPPPATAATCGELPFITAFNSDPLKWRGGLVHSAIYDWEPYPVIEQNMTNVRLRGNIWLSYYPALPGVGMTELRGACQNQCLGKQPVIFVHGYKPFGELGGGPGTWHCAFDYVTSLGGAPFEFRWRANMRFEDAAYQLAQAIGHVTQLTGRKPLIVGHSMGGELISTYLAGLAQMPSADGQSYVAVGYDSAAARNGRQSAAVAGVVTVSSPLSGIATADEGATYNLPQGRDVHPPAATIEVCNDFTCGESGYSGTTHTYPGWRVAARKVTDFQALFGITLGAPGSLIRNLYDTWRNAAMPPLHYDVLVSAWYTPQTPEWTDADWGDGLIAVTGMQVLPGHFVGTDAQGQPYNYIRTAGRALTAGEKLRARIPANIDYTFMLTPSLTGGYYGYAHANNFLTYAAVWWGFTPNPNADAAAFPQKGELDYYGTFAHSLKPVLDRAYAAAAVQPPVFTTLLPVALVMGGQVHEAGVGARAAGPLASAPVLIVFSVDGVYRGMVQTATGADGVFDLDLGARLDDFGITTHEGLEVQIRIGNDTTHDAATVVLASPQLSAITNVGLIELPPR